MGRSNSFISVVLIVLAAMPLAHADLITLDSTTQTFQNTDCAKTNSCDLKDFVLTQENYKLTIPSQNITAYGTRMHAYYDTSSVAALETYGIGQFIQGSEYDSQLINGKVVDSDSVAIEHYGQEIPFRFPQEVIDGFVPDPLDWGEDPSAPSRFFYYLNKDIGSAEPGADDYYGNQKPGSPRLYLRDMPGVAEVFADGTARNISLRFRDCIYKAAEVPRSVADTNLAFATPLQCFTWTSSFVYDFGSKTFTRPASLASIIESSLGLCDQ